MAKNYKARDWLGDVLLGMASGASGQRLTPMYQAQAAGMPEGAGVSPEIFRAMMGERRASIPDQYKERAMGIREAGLGISQARLDFAKEQQVWREEVKADELKHKKQGLKSLINYRLRTEDKFGDSFKLMMEYNKRKDLTDDQRQFIQVFTNDLMQKSGLPYGDINLIKDDPDYFESLVSGAKEIISSITGGGKSKTKSAIKPVNSRSTSTPRPRGKQITGEDKQALDWAKDNPNDPRAGDIKKRLGI